MTKHDDLFAQVIAICAANDMVVIVVRNDEKEFDARFGPMDLAHPDYCDEWLNLEVRKGFGGSKLISRINWKSSSITYGRDEALKLARMLQTVACIETLVHTVIA